ncbi:MAG: hypothetical protein ACE1ZS_12510 [Candidatus Poribacteria bacterium]
MKILIDTDVMFDTLTKREPFYKDSAHEGCEIIVTRNKRDFPQIGLKLMTPKEFIDYFTNENIHLMHV